MLRDQGLRASRLTSLRLMFLGAVILGFLSTASAEELRDRGVEELGRSGAQSPGSEGLRAEEQRAEGSTPQLKFKIPPLPRPRVEMATVNRMNNLLPPNPKPWPRGFSATFYTNLTTILEDSPALPQHAIKGKIWYQEGSGQRVFHGAGSKECIQFYNSEASCTLVFNQGGMFAETENGCCLDMPEIKSPPRNWTLTPHEFIGTKRIRGRMCHGFRYTGAEGLRVTNEDNHHHYYQDVKTDLPCLFTFPNNPLMTWVFEVDSILIEPQESQLFNVTQGCKAKQCPHKPKPKPSGDVEKQAESGAKEAVGERSTEPPSKGDTESKDQKEGLKVAGLKTEGPEAEGPSA